jgi:hypothetical protein
VPGEAPDNWDVPSFFETPGTSGPIPELFIVHPGLGQIHEPGTIPGSADPGTVPPGTAGSTFLGVSEIDYPLGKNSEPGTVTPGTAGGATYPLGKRREEGSAPGETPGTIPGGAEPGTVTPGTAGSTFLGVSEIDYPLGKNPEPGSTPGTATYPLGKYPEPGTEQKPVNYFLGPDGEIHGTTPGTNPEEKPFTIGNWPAAEPDTETPGTAGTTLYQLQQQFTQRIDSYFGNIANSDGIITEASFNAAKDNIVNVKGGPEGLRGWLQNHSFADVDADHDGQISRNELTLSMFGQGTIPPGPLGKDPGLLKFFVSQSIRQGLE